MLFRSLRETCSLYRSPTGDKLYRWTRGDHVRRTDWNSERGHIGGPKISEISRGFHYSSQVRVLIVHSKGELINIGVKELHLLPSRMELDGIASSHLLSATSKAFFGRVVHVYI